MNFFQVHTSLPANDKRGFCSGWILASPAWPWLGQAPKWRTACTAIASSSREATPLNSATAVEHRPCLLGFIHIPCISKEMGLQHIKYLQLPEKRQRTALKGDKNIALKYLQWTHHIPSGSSLGSGVLGLWSLYCVFSQVPLEFWKCVIVPGGCVWRKWLHRWGSFGELDTCAPKQDGFSYRVDIALGLCQVYVWIAKNST